MPSFPNFPPLGLVTNLTRDKSMLASKTPWLRLLFLVLFTTLTVHFLLHISIPRASVFSTTTLSPASHSDDNEQGLLPEIWKTRDPDGQQCLSRFQYQSYRRHRSTSRPSDLLLRRLREYEHLHRRCAGEIDLDSDHRGANSSCRFVVAVGYMGLGNKIISLVATFLYALLTNRVLLVSTDENMDRLFCEPFPDSSWLLPRSRMELLHSLNDSSRFGRVVAEHGSGDCNTSGVRYPEVVLTRITHEYDRDDTKFFCEEQQDVIRRQVPWLFVRSNVFYVPSLYYVPSFRAELEELFPGQDAIFHHLARYLVHPSNRAWRRTARFYDSYLAHAGTLVGIQMRTQAGLESARRNYATEVVRCAMENRVLPKVNRDDAAASAANSTIAAAAPVDGWNSSTSSSIAVLLTSLNQAHVDAVRETFLSGAAEADVRVTVHQPSHEEYQKTGETQHDEQALVEIYLLSMAEAMITSPLSTFGYAAQGLAHLRPWLMWIRPNPEHAVCSRVFASDPCFLNFEPYSCDCVNRTREETTLESRVRRCEEDEPNPKWVKVVNGSSKI